jgi:hypothetical protein
MDSYLTIAAKVLREARQPLSARQILRAAYRLQIVPANLHGKTQHKTLHARIAEDILHHRSKSQFVRTQPGRFFLRTLMAERATPSQFKREYIAPLRANQLRSFYVLCTDRTTLEAAQHQHGHFIRMDCLDARRFGHKSLATLHADKTTFHVKIVVMIWRDRHFLLKRTHSPFGDPISGYSSAGLIDFVKREDRTLFSNDPYGLREAATRTLVEQLYLSHQELEALASPGVLQPLFFIVDVNNQKLRNAVAAVVICRCPEQFITARRFDRADGFQWHAIAARMNNLDHLDPWSQYLLQSLYNRPAYRIADLFA